MPQDLWSWGRNNTGQLGTNDTTSYSSPVSVVGERSYSKIAGGGGLDGHSLAIDSTTGMVYAWGNNDYGQLGTNNTTSYSSPVSIVRVASYVAIDAGDGFSGAIDSSNGMVWMWGDNGVNVGQLGDGTNGTNRSSPVSIVRSSSYTALSLGSNQSFAIDGSNGMIWVWGGNGDGQLGTNNTTAYSSPVSIARSSSYSAVSAGYNDGMAIDAATGNIWAWGNNYAGKLGDNSTTNKSSPVAIARVSSYSAVSAGANHTIAIDASNGMIWAWGFNYYGQLGTNNTTAYSSPVSIARSASYIAISAGINLASPYCLALESDGTVWAWGRNNYGGPLGDGTTTYRSSPVSIARAPTGSYIEIASDGTHSMAIDESPVPTCWTYTAKYKNSNRLYSANGPGLFPKVLQVPKNVDTTTGRMIDEGLLIEPDQFKIIQ